MVINEEVWKLIENSKNYFISNKGRVKRTDFTYWSEVNKSYSIRKEKILTPNNTNSKKYYRIRISYLNGTVKMMAIHRLVALAFIENPQNKEQVNHIDGNKDNNCVENLEWVTGAENMEHRYDKLKLFSHTKGENCNFTKLSEEQVKSIPKLLEEGLTKTAISKKFNVRLSTICEITAGRSWNHLNLFPPTNKKALKYLRY